MARTNNLTNFLNDVSSAIKQKTGDSTPIPASEFDTEILSIETAGTYQSKSITIDSNGTQVITPDENYDAIEQLVITVNVPVSQLQSKAVTITSNGNISILPDANYNGMARVDLTVDVDTDSVDYQVYNGAFVSQQGTVDRDHADYPGYKQIEIDLAKYINRTVTITNTGDRNYYGFTKTKPGGAQTPLNSHRQSTTGSLVYKYTGGDDRYLVYDFTSTGQDNTVISVTISSGELIEKEIIANGIYNAEDENVLRF